MLRPICAQMARAEMFRRVQVMMRWTTLQLHLQFNFHEALGVR